MFTKGFTPQKQENHQGFRPGRSGSASQIPTYDNLTTCQELNGKKSFCFAAVFTKKHPEESCFKDMYGKQRQNPDFPPNTLQ